MRMIRIGLSIICTCFSVNVLAVHVGCNETHSNTIIQDALDNMAEFDILSVSGTCLNQGVITFTKNNLTMSRGEIEGVFLIHGVQKTLLIGVTINSNGEGVTPAMDVRNFGEVRLIN